MKRQCVVAALALVLLGSCSSVTYYRPAEASATKRGGNACATDVYFEKPLGDGTRLSVRADESIEGAIVWLVFAIPKDQSVRLASAEVRISAAGNARSQVIPIATFESGSGPLKVPVVSFEPTALLRGTARYAHLTPPYGPDERFRARLSAQIGQTEQFTINLPTIAVNGAPAPVGPITFVRTTETRVMCVQ